jgi:hypothetical protein
MVTALIAMAIAQVSAAADLPGRASAEVALAFIREHDAGTAARLGAELRPWLIAPAGSRVDPAAARTVRAAGEELKAMLVGHRTMWGGHTGYTRAAAAADTAWRAIAADLPAAR